MSEQSPIAYRVQDAVKASGISRSTLYELVKSGRLPSVKAAGRRLILREDLEAFLKAGRVAHG